MTCNIHTEITTEIITQNFGHARRVAGLTQAELAERTGITQGFISLMESGHRRCSGAVLDRVTDELEQARKERIERREQMAMLHGWQS